MGKTITAIIITKDEEKMLPGCLKSLDWVDEILVIDTGSSDNTMKVAAKAGARVVSYTTGKSFSEWRNKGLSESKTDWVLYVDADERVNSKLRSEIVELINTTSHSHGAYAIPRSNLIFKKEFRHGGWWPDYVKRLYLTKSLSKWKGDLHEEPVFNGEIVHLKNHLDHLKHETIFEMVQKTNKWSEIEGRLMFDANHPPMNIIRFMTACFREFWKRMIVEKAYLDGKEGIVMAIYQVFSRFCSYAKLWEMQINRKANK